MMRYGDVEVFYRSLSAKEYFTLGMLEDTSSDTVVEDMLIDAAVLEPDNPRDILGEDSACLTDLCNKIVESSVMDQDEVIEEARRLREIEEGNVFTIMISQIISHIPAYKPEDLEDLNLEQLLDKAILAEMVYINPEKTRVHIIRDPEDEKKQATINAQASTPEPMMNPHMKFNQNNEQNLSAQISKASNALAEEMARNGVSTKPIAQSANENSEGANTLADKIRSLNKSLRKN